MKSCVIGIGRAATLRTAGVISTALITAASVWAQQPPPAGGTLANVRVGGMRLINESNVEAGICPFGMQKSFSVSVIGELPDTVVAVKKVAVTTAVTDTGVSLLSDEDRRNTSNTPRLSKDQKIVVFDVQLRAPTQEVKAIKELSGAVACVMGKGTKSVELGTIPLRANAQGKALDARILSVGKAWNQADTYELRMTILTQFAAVKEVKLLDASGNVIPMETNPLKQEDRFNTNRNAMKKITPNGAQIILQRGGFRRNDELNSTIEIILTHHGDFPPEAGIVVEMTGELQECEIPFKIENFDLCGRPMK